MQKSNGFLDTFWKEINGILEKSSDRSMLQNIARLRYVVKSDPSIKSWFELEARVSERNNLYIAEFFFEALENNTFN
jgi:hypothetical protein